MKKRIQLARTGIFGQAGTRVTKKDLEEIVETFSGESPITLGHQLADYAPALGQVTKVSLREENGQPVLEGDIELHQLLADAVEEGFYKKWSIGAPKRASDGKRYLHHLAFLGAVPPKVPGLKELSINLADMADCPKEDVFLFGEMEDRANFLARIGEERERAKWRLDDVREILNKLGTWASEMAVSGTIPSEFQNQVQVLSDTLNFRAPNPEVEALRAQVAAANKAARETQLAGLQSAIAGKVPAASLPLVMALADKLDLEGEFELSDGEETVRLKGAALLKKIFESLPLPVKPGTHHFADESEVVIDMTGIMLRI